VLSRLITTIDDSHNGFRTVLLPAALSQSALSSQSLRHAILALSATHLGGHEAATQYKLAAIRLLSDSIRREENETVGQFATCMMLCVCDVFDSADGSWYIHLGAAKSLLSKVESVNSDADVGFLRSWMEYHDVLADFSHGSQVGLRDGGDVLKLPSQASDNSIVCRFQPFFLNYLTYPR
jgi:hypothetical protein